MTLASTVKLIGVLNDMSACVWSYCEEWIPTVRSIWRHRSDRRFPWKPMNPDPVLLRYEESMHIHKQPDARWLSIHSNTPTWLHSPTNVLLSREETELTEHTEMLKGCSEAKYDAPTRKSCSNARQATQVPNLHRFPKHLFWTSILHTPCQKRHTPIPKLLLSS